MLTYGHRGHDCRNNLLYTAEGHVVYMVAAIAVVYKKEAHAQVCSRTLTYADVCRRMPTYANVC
jgi:hypothetical protein